MSENHPGQCVGGMIWVKWFGKLESWNYEDESLLLPNPKCTACGIGMKCMYCKKIIKSHNHFSNKHSVFSGLCMKRKGHRK